MPLPILPYTDFQQKNLDWIIKTVKDNDEAVQAKLAEMTEAISDAEDAVEAAVEDAEDAATLANTKAGLADDAATLANTKAGLANTAAGSATSAASLANSAYTKWATPYVATTVAGMTDTDKIYVYTGSELGYTAGHWYYYSGGTWTDGGVFVGSITDAVLFNTSQSKTEAEKAQARSNAGAASESDFELVTQDTKNLFDFADITSKTNFSVNGQTIVNTNTDTRANLQIQVFVLANDNSVITASNPLDVVSANVKTSRTVTPSSAGTKIRVKHNGGTRDFQFEFSCNTEANKSYTFSFVPTGIDPTTVGGIVLTDIQFEQNSVSTYYLPHITAYDGIAGYKANEAVVSLNAERYLPVESGSITGGAVADTSYYIRTSEFVHVNKGDILTINSPVGFGDASLYRYNTPCEASYVSGVSVGNVSANTDYVVEFDSEYWIKVKGSTYPVSTINKEDIFNFSKALKLTQLYDVSEGIYPAKDFGLDYDTINTSISGKFNLAVQTDTHMSKYLGLTTSEYKPTDYAWLDSVAETVNKLDIDVFTNLGDFIRGYGCDPAFESRANIDAMMESYKKINTNKAYVVGNHDDGNLYYYTTSYNDKQSNEQVMFPAEQFNRYIKYGVNNKGTQNYYYADINGVRIITLYQRDFDYSDTIPQIEAFKIGSDQLSWLENTALDTNLPVIVLTHAPLLSSLYATSREGFDSALALLETFVSGGGKVIAVLSGHTHTQAYDTSNGINNIVFDDGYNYFELVSVDLENETITCKSINRTLADITLTY